MDCKGGQRKWATSKNVKRCQNIFFDTFRHFSRRARESIIGKKYQYVFRDFQQISRGTNFPAPFGGGSDVGREKTNKDKGRDTPTSRPQTSCGPVPFVQWKCPICPAGILSNLCGITHKSGRDVADVPRLAPNRPCDISEAHRPPNSLCVLCLQVCSSR